MWTQTATHMAQAVAAKLQRGAGEAQAIVNHIEGALLVEGRARVAIGHNDLHGAGTVDDRAHAAPILIPAPRQSATSHTPKNSHGTACGKYAKQHCVTLAWSSDSC